MINNSLPVQLKIDLYLYTSPSFKMLCNGRLKNTSHLQMVNILSILHAVSNIHNT